MNRKILAFIVIVVLIVIALFAINSTLKQDTEEPEIVPEEVIVPSVSAPNQAGGMEVFITEAALRDAGFIAVHREFDGVASTTIGVSELLPVGTTASFLVSLDEEAIEGDMLYAMIHVDDGDGVWNGELDLHLDAEDGGTVGVSFQILDEGKLEDETKL